MEYSTIRGIYIVLVIKFKSNKLQFIQICQLGPNWSNPQWTFDHVNKCILRTRSFHRKVSTKSIQYNRFVGELLTKMRMFLYSSYESLSVFFAHLSMFVTLSKHLQQKDCTVEWFGGSWTEVYLLFAKVELDLLKRGGWVSKCCGSRKVYIVSGVQKRRPNSLTLFAFPLKCWKGSLQQTRNLFHFKQFFKEQDFC